MIKSAGERRPRQHLPWEDLTTVEQTQDREMPVTGMCPFCGPECLPDFGPRSSLQQPVSILSELCPKESLTVLGRALTLNMEAWGGSQCGFHVAGGGGSACPPRLAFTDPACPPNHDVLMLIRRVGLRCIHRNFIDTSDVCDPCQIEGWENTEELSIPHLLQRSAGTY